MVIFRAIYKQKTGLKARFLLKGLPSLRGLSLLSVKSGSGKTLDLWPNRLSENPATQHVPLLTITVRLITGCYITLSGTPPAVINQNQQACSLSVDRPFLLLTFDLGATFVWGLGTQLLFDTQQTVVLGYTV